MVQRAHASCVLRFPVNSGDWAANRSPLAVSPNATLLLAVSPTEVEVFARLSACKRVPDFEIPRLTIRPR